MSDYPSYEGALAAAGAKVICFEQFGSYQGDWWAKVSYEGQTGWINGGYGSCSGCDAIQSEFDYDAQKCEPHRWSYEDKLTDCGACKEANEVYQTKYADFGRSYLDSIMTQEEAEAKASENISWDSDAPKMLEFIRENEGTN